MTASVVQLHVLYTHVSTQTCLKASRTRGGSVLQSMANATEEIVKRKDPKTDPHKKGEASDAQSSKVQNVCLILVLTECMH